MALDIHEVHDLHKNHKLHAAEQGWCQVLCVLPNIQHRNLSGWVSNNKYGHPDGK